MTPTPWEFEQNMRGDGQPISGSYTVYGEKPSFGERSEIPVAEFYNADDAERCVRAVNSHAELVAALEAIVEEQCEYMHINNLGDPEKQHNIRRARAALRRAKG